MILKSPFRVFFFFNYSYAIGAAWFYQWSIPILKQKKGSKSFCYVNSTLIRLLYVGIYDCEMEGYNCDFMQHTKKIIKLIILDSHGFSLVYKCVFIAL